MVRLARKTQKIFGNSAGTNERGVIGSFAAGSPAYSTDPDTIQSLSNFIDGWYAVVVGQNSPAIQDMNALDFLITRQLAYIFESGIPEWISTTEYYIGSVAADSTGNIFVSLADNNLNNALTDTTKWRLITGPNTVSINPATQSPYTLTAADRGKTFLVNTANGAMTFNLPAAFLNFQFAVKDSAGSAPTNNITIARNGSESIEGIAGNYSIKNAWSHTNFDCDGTNWFILNSVRVQTGQLNGINASQATAHTLTYQSPQDIYISSPASAINQDLPTTNVLAGQLFRLIVSDATETNYVALRSSGGNEIDRIGGQGFILVQALQNAPTTAGHWKIIDLYEQQAVTITWAFGSGATFNTVMVRSRRNNSVNMSIQGGTVSGSSSGYINVSGAVPSRYRPTYDIYGYHTPIQNNTQLAQGYFQIAASSGNIGLGVGAGGSWGTNNNNGFYGWASSWVRS